MCPAKSQTQYNLMENTTPVSTRALLLVLENIKSNSEVDYKTQNPTKMKGAEGKHKMESSDSCIPKKPKKVGWSKKHCVLCKKHGAHSIAKTCMIVVILTKTALRSKVMGVQAGPSLRKRSAKA